MSHETVYGPPIASEVNMKVLTLSHTYEPLGVVSWEKAVNLVFSGKVLTLAEYEQRVSSPTFSMKVPSVIVFKSNKRTRVKLARFSRKNVWVRDEGKCQYCGIHVSPDSYTLDHVVPKTRGGTTHWGNVVTCCYPCNQKKGDKSVQQAGMRLLKPVVKPQVLPYIQDVEFHAEQKHLPPEWKYWLGQTL
jgi:5-methylcytosine-specific restriction endonuclease McrA